MSHVAARRGTKTQEIKVEKQNGNAATEPKLLHFVTFIFFPPLPLSVVSETEENCQRLPPNYSFFSTCLFSEGKRMCNTQTMAGHPPCLHRQSQPGAVFFFPTEATFKHNTGRASSAHNASS